MNLQSTNLEGRDDVEADRVSSGLMTGGGRHQDHQSVPTQSSNFSSERSGKQTPSYAKKSFTGPSFIVSFSISKETIPSEGRVECANLGTQMNDAGDVPFVVSGLQSFASPLRTQSFREDSTCVDNTSQTPVSTSWVLKLAGINTNDTCFVTSNDMFQTSSNIKSLPFQSVGETHPLSTWHKHWTDEEDEILRYAVAEEKNHKWKSIAKKYFNNTRSAEQCKSRWNNVRYSFVKECMTHDVPIFFSHNIHTPLFCHFFYHNSI